MHEEETISSHQGETPVTAGGALDALFKIRNCLVEVKGSYSASCLADTYKLAVLNLWEARRIAFRSRGPDRPWSLKAVEALGAFNRDPARERPKLTYEHPIPLGLIVGSLLSDACQDPIVFRRTLVRLDVPCVLTVQENLVLNGTKRDGDRLKLRDNLPVAYKDVPVPELPSKALMARYEMANLRSEAGIGFPAGGSPEDVSLRLERLLLDLPVPRA